jgi:hypothetical protein
MTRYRKTAFAGLFCLGLIASPQMQARAQTAAPVAGKGCPIPPGYTIVAAYVPSRVGDPFSCPAEQPSPGSQRLFRVVLLVDVVVVAILAAIVVSRLSLVPGPEPTCRTKQPLARAGHLIDRPGPG